MNDFPTPVNFIHAFMLQRVKCSFHSLFTTQRFTHIFLCIVLIVNKGNSFLGLKSSWYVVLFSLLEAFHKTIKVDELFLRKIFRPKSVSLSHQIAYFYAKYQASLKVLKSFERTKDLTDKRPLS